MGERLLDGIAWPEGWSVEFRDGLSVKATHTDGQVRFHSRYSEPTSESIQRIDEWLRSEVPLRGVKVVRLQEVTHG